MVTCSGLRQDFNFVSPAAENTLSASRYGCSNNKQLDVGNFCSVHLPKMVQLACSLNKDWQLDNLYYWNETFGSVRWLNTFHKDARSTDNCLKSRERSDGSIWQENCTMLVFFSASNCCFRYVLMCWAAFCMFLYASIATECNERVERMVGWEGEDGRQRRSQ